jgi:exodeoxyribonuclease V alpha subunit
MIRVKAGISFALAEATGQGHCGLPEAEVLAATAELLEVEAPLVERALGLELEGGDVVADTLDGRRGIFLAGIYRAEQVIAERLRALARGRLPWPEIDATLAIPWVEKRTGLALAASQRVSSDIGNPSMGDTENPATSATVTPRQMPMRVLP